MSARPGVSGVSGRADGRSAGPGRDAKGFKRAVRQLASTFPEYFAGYQIDEDDRRQPRIYGVAINGDGGRRAQVDGLVEPGLSTMARELVPDVAVEVPTRSLVELTALHERVFHDPEVQAAMQTLTILESLSVVELGVADRAAQVRLRLRYVREPIVVVQRHVILF